MKNIVKPVSADIKVETVIVTIDPIHTRDGNEITELSVRGGKVISAAGKNFPHMGSGFFEENFTRDTLRGIKRVGRREWERVRRLRSFLNLISSI
jgi:hypothetical protein